MIRNKADLLVRYQVAVDRGGMAMGTATSSTLDVGTLVLDLYNPAAKQLVWTGHATKTINPSKDPRKNQRNIGKAMQKLLKDFPPTQK
jgi:hypothetical protein